MKLAFADAFQNPNTVYTVTYTYGEANKPGGSMVDGDTVKLKKGMHFNVAFTTRSLSPDLKRLRDEGYEVRVQSEHLVVSNVPHVNSKREVRFGSLISNLNVDTEGVAAKPNTHVVHFDGEHPCTKEGAEIARIKHQTCHHELAKGLVSEHSFSCKPPDGIQTTTQR